MPGLLGDDPSPLDLIARGYSPREVYGTPRKPFSALSLYGNGYVDPRLKSDSKDVTTRDVLGIMPREKQWDRDEILPLAREVGGDGSWHLAMPGFLKSAWDTVKEVGSAPLTGAYPIDGAARQHMIDAAGAVVGPQAGIGIARGALAHGLRDQKILPSEPLVSATGIADRGINQASNKVGFEPPQKQQRTFLDTMIQFNARGVGPTGALATSQPDQASARGILP